MTPSRPTPEAPKVDIAERGARGATSDRRLFMQLLVFTGCPDALPLGDTLADAGIAGTLYEDLHDPRGVGLATFSEDPGWFVGELRHALNRPPFDRLTLRHELAMFGRSYAIGYEPNLDEVLIDRPRRTLLDAERPWAVWYPLRRKGAFQQLDAEEQRAILMEHGSIGRAWVQSDLVHDIRLACHGLDAADNDFVIGLIGRDLAPLSKIVETMRATRQTSTYLEQLGPFFVGRKIWQSAP